MTSAQIWRQNNKEKIKAYQREWKKQNCEHVALYQRQWQAQNRDKLIIYGKTQRERHAERLRQRSRKYYADNPDRYKQYGIKRRSKLRKRCLLCPNSCVHHSVLSLCRQCLFVASRLVGGPNGFCELPQRLIELKNNEILKDKIVWLRKTEKQLKLTREVLNHRALAH